MKVVVALADLEADAPLVDVAAALSGGDLLVLSVVEVPADEPLGGAQHAARERRRAMRVFERPGARTHVAVARDPWAAVREVVESERPDLLVVGWRREGWDIFGTTIDKVLRDPPCDLAVVKGPLARARRVLVPVRGGRYAQLAVSLATAFARARDGSVTLLHVRGENEPPRMGLYQLLGTQVLDERIDHLETREGDPVAVIAEELRSHDAVILGATGRETGDPLGPVGQAVVASAPAALVVRTRTPVASSVFAGRAALPADRAARSRAIGELVDRWFVENTFASSEFADLRRLVDEKERQGLRISVVLPTLNEAATIRKVIRAIRTRLCERFPLVDELIVMDSDSTDRTRDIAQAEGVPVHVHQRTLAEVGAQRGKGEAMWKSLHVTRGDLVVWVDTDIANIHPKFVYGIVGPLLRRPAIQFVKAFYRRPLRMGGEIQATGGGRVTELTARPIFNLFFPELSGMLQPLSGEQGGRRSLLENIPFFTGYGVETGLLIDTLRVAGLHGIAQVDMKQRIHRNQSLYDLSKMSFEILQVALRRVGEVRGLSWEDANATMKLILPDNGGFRLDVVDIAPVERPPMATVPAYRASHPR
ncbi:MAG TPA: glucosyl-3-phosphoglycerate synthase [Candidatus Limnocylindria bacterium]|nr:glucosyl-3-phosphoglycerate synthase [Candidatus Limnocylindria bacterium]